MESLHDHSVRSFAVDVNAKTLRHLRSAFTKRRKKIVPARFVLDVVFERTQQQFSIVAEWRVWHVRRIAERRSAFELLSPSSRDVIASGRVAEDEEICAVTIAHDAPAALCRFPHVR